MGQKLFLRRQTFLLRINRELKIQRRGPKREGQKINRLNKQNNNLARASYFFVLFFPFLHDYDLKMPYFAFMEDVNK